MSGDASGLAAPSGPSAPSIVFGAITASVLRHRRAWAVAMVLVFGVCAAGLGRLRFDLSSKAFYGDGDASTAAVDRLHARWGHDDATVAILVEADDGGDVLGAPRLDAIRAIADAVRGRPDVARVDAVTDHPASAAVAGGSTAARAWLAAPPVVPLLLAADGRTAAVAAHLRFSSDDLPQTVAAVAAIADIVAQHDGDAGLRLTMGGLPVIRAGFARAAFHDQGVLVPASLLMITMVLVAVFRRTWQVVIPLVLAIVPTVMLMGLLGWSGTPIGLLNQGYFTLLPVIAIADGIHLVTRVAEHGRDAVDPAGRTRAIVAGCGRVGLSCLLTSVTTAVGFGSLLVSEMPMLRSFGGWAAVGVLLAFAVLLVLAPLLLARIDDLGPHGRAGASADHWLVRFTRPGRAHPIATVLVACGLTAGMLWVARDVPIDNRVSDLLDRDHPAAQASAVLDARMGGTLSLELELSGPPGHWDDPANVRALAELEDWIAAVPEVRAVIGPTVLLRASGAAPTGDTAAMKRAWSRLSAIGLRAAVLDDAASTAHTSVRVADLGGLRFEALVATIEARARDVPGVQVTVGGTTALAYRGVNRIATELRDGIALAFVVITIGIGVAFGSVRAAAASILPNAIPLVLGYAVIAASVGRFDPLGGIVLAVALGIAVDDTIHLIGRTAELERTGVPLERALDDAIARSGMACAVTSLVLASGLALFGLSSFPPLRLLGVLGATVIVIALVCDLFVLPAVLMLLRRRAVR